tara:strand:- start:3084 stop:3275 length:192 start_codon:yes stop_codon:yes gene_type:complete
MTVSVERVLGSLYFTSITVSNWIREGFLWAVNFTILLETLKPVKFDCKISAHRAFKPEAFFTG